MFIKSNLKNYKVEFNYKIKDSILKNKDYIFIIDKNVFKKFNFGKYNIKKKFLITPTEKVKDFFYLKNIINKILKFKVNKRSTLVAIGGGIVQDITSFLSSILFRGINWFYLPTTIIGQCDSCIGGKTSINYKGIKNQLGNFYPPEKVIINFNFLKNLDKTNLSSGIGEMAHYFLVKGGSELKYFNQNYKKAIDGNMLILPKLIKKSLLIKKKFIEIDEFDTGIRLLLNYGHSFGHALERYVNNKIPHGVAVAYGMDISNFISYKLGFLKKKQFIKIQSDLKEIYKVKKTPRVNIKKYIKFLEKDKKNIENKIRVILSRGPGKMFLFKFQNNKKLAKILNIYFN